MWREWTEEMSSAGRTHESELMNQLTESDRLDGKVKLWGREASWLTNWRWMLTAGMGRSRRPQDGKG